MSLDERLAALTARMRGSSRAGERLARYEARLVDESEPDGTVMVTRDGSLFAFMSREAFDAFGDGRGNA